MDIHLSIVLIVCLLLANLSLKEVFQVVFSFGISEPSKFFLLSAAV